MADRACEQSSVQLRVANGTKGESTLSIKKIELLDENGDKLRDLQPRDPSLWANDGYQPWDQHVGANEHFELIQRAGGTLNGSTWLDRTNYYETVPAHQLELALWLEADRMGRLLPAMTQQNLSAKPIGQVIRRRNAEFPRSGSGS